LINGVLARLKLKTGHNERERNIYDKAFRGRGSQAATQQNTGNCNELKEITLHL
jgi:hypothetical protein